MGNWLEMCESQQSSRLNNRFTQSAIVEFKNQLPVIHGKLDFEKKTSFNKIQRAALQFCLYNKIDRSYVPTIAKLLVYKHHHFFAAFKNLPQDRRQIFVQQLGELNVQLIDSLYNHLVQKRKKMLGNSSTFNNIFQPASTINVSQIEPELKQNAIMHGVKLLKARKTIMIMLTGQGCQQYQNGKGLTRLPLQKSPTLLAILLNRLRKKLQKIQQLIFENENIFKVQSTQSNETELLIPIILVCSQKTKSLLYKFLETNNYFGFNKNTFKIATISKLPIIDSKGRYCLNFQYKILASPHGTAKCLQTIFDQQQGVKEFLKRHKVDYLHVIGDQNLKQEPGDPFLIGLLHTLYKDVAGKTVEPIHAFENEARYIQRDSKFYLLHMNELQQSQNVQLMKACPVALFSMVFRLSYIYSLQINIQEELYMAKRYHAKDVIANYYDFQIRKPLINQRVISFQKDIRDYIHCSTNSIIIQYPRSNYIPLKSHEPIKETLTRYQASLN